MNAAPPSPRRFPWIRLIGGCGCLGQLRLPALPGDLGKSLPLGLLQAGEHVLGRGELGLGLTSRGSHLVAGLLGQTLAVGDLRLGLRDAEPGGLRAPQVGDLGFLELSHDRCLREELRGIIGHEDLESRIHAAAGVRRPCDVVDRRHDQLELSALPIGAVADRIEIGLDVVQSLLRLVRALGRRAGLHFQVTDLIGNLLDVLTGGGSHVRRHRAHAQHQYAGQNRGDRGPAAPSSASADHPPTPFAGDGRDGRRVRE